MEAYKIGVWLVRIVCNIEMCLIYFLCLIKHPHKDVET